MKHFCKNILIVFTVFFCAGKAFAQPDAKPITIGITEHLHSAILGETRTINIYLPEGYDTAVTTKYPVIIIPDGGMEEDFFHIAGIVRYNTQPWINRFPKSIVVGIENVNRRRDFTFPVSDLNFLDKVGISKTSMPSYGGSDLYILFLEKELLPFISSKYRTDDHRTVIGESLAGLLCTEILLKHPGLFDTYMIISPSLWWGDEKLLKDAAGLLQSNLKGKIKVCVSAPNKAEDQRMYKEANTLYSIIKKQTAITAYFDYLPGELHSTVIHQAVYNAFKLFYPRTEFGK